MKVYVLFKGTWYYPRGGAEDCQDIKEPVFGSPEEAWTALQSTPSEYSRWAHCACFDTDTRRVEVVWAAEGKMCRTPEGDSYCWRLL